ncbi:hypothetical protein HYV79_05130 [Candidatus Woesearchaeota archaeon]|nr:hypothetical protein [Candidatus Woesearchaeota archaeon]
MLPKTKEVLEKVYKKCEKKFVKIDNSLFREYQELAYEDVDSAKKEENPRWAVTKAYQALFLMCNSILVKKLGFYSKDHNCVIIALLSNKLIPEKTLTQIHQMLKKKDKLFAELLPKNSFYEELSNIRITRNNYLYLPKTLRKVKIPSEKIIEEIRQLLQLLGEIE